MCVGKEEGGRGVGFMSEGAGWHVPRLTLVTSLEVSKKEGVSGKCGLRLMNAMLSQVKVAHIHTSSEQ